jgi:hypothetical protein
MKTINDYEKTLILPFCVIMVAPMAYGLLGVLGLFVLLPGFVVTYILAVERGGFPPI